MTDSLLPLGNMEAALEAVPSPYLGASWAEVALTVNRNEVSQRWGLRHCTRKLDCEGSQGAFRSTRAGHIALTMSVLWMCFKFPPLCALCAKLGTLLKTSLTYPVT